MNRKHKTIRKRISATRYSLKTNRGFVLSLAVLISGILLSIGLAIFSNALKELILSSSGRESQFAFTPLTPVVNARCIGISDIRLYPRALSQVLPTISCHKGAVFHATTKTLPIRRRGGMACSDGALPLKTDPRLLRFLI